MDLADNAVFSDANVRCVQENDVSVFGHVVAEGTPASLSCEGNASETAKVEHGAVAFAHQARDILVELIVVELVRARALDKHGVFFGDTQIGEFFTDEVINVRARKCSTEVGFD